MTRPRALDLFAGAGGASLGLTAAGFAVVAAVEWDADAADTYRRNLGDHVIQRDIATVQPDDLPDADLWHASPPCQGFSSAGKRDPTDPRNGLWAEVYRLVAAKRPMFLTIENVLGMSTTRMDRRILLAFEGLGYRGARWVLNAADYGVPQTRKRMFLAFSRDGLAVPVPAPTHAKPPRHLMFGLQPWVTVRQALGIGGTMTDQRGDFGQGAVWYDGDERPARVITGVAQQVLEGDASDLPERYRPKGRTRAWLERLDAPAASGSQPGRHGSLHRPEQEPGSFILDAPSRALLPGAHGQPGYSPRHVAGYVPNVPLDEPCDTILTPGDAGGGAEPVRHRLGIRGRMAGDGNGAGEDDPAPTVSAMYAMDVFDLDGERRTYADHEGRVHDRPAHSARLRRLTVRECAILQNFPPDYQFTGSQTEQYRQVGNAVPPGLMRAVASSVLAAMASADEDAA